MALIILQELSVTHSSLKNMEATASECVNPVPAILPV